MFFILLFDYCILLLFKFFTLFYFNINKFNNNILLLFIISNFSINNLVRLLLYFLELDYYIN